MIKTTIDASRKEVRKFGLMFALICAGVATYSLYKEGNLWPWFAGGAAFFLATGLLAYPVLRPVYVGWMKFAFVLGWINTRLLLGLFFYGILSPIGLIFRLMGKDLIHQKIDRSAPSYWIKRERVALDKKRYEQLF